MSLGKNIPHDSAKGHVSGESIYIDDRPSYGKEFKVGYLGSPIACGKLLSLDFSKARDIPGIIGFITADDVDHNLWGTIVKEQPLLIEEKIAHFDEPLCLIVAETNDAINEAKSLIEVECVEEQAIFTIDEAIAAKSFLYNPNPFIQGDVVKGFKDSKYILEGEFECGGQEHFYMENQAAIVELREDDQYYVHSSSQHPTETQHVVAKALGVSYHKVVCEVKRMGGGFGGKESQAAPIAAYAALAAKKFKCNARMVLTKDEDMQVTGKRHPFKNFYKVGFDSDGMIKAAEVKLYSDAGAYADLSSSILERAMFHFDNAYYLPNVKIEAWACRTNRQSNTAFRGFGGPQGAMTLESIIEDAAIKLNMDSATIREKNLYRPGSDLTPYGQRIDEHKLEEIFEKLLSSCDYKNRRKEIDEFNAKNSGSLKGLAISATKFGIAFTARHLNQGSAQVNLHLDGTIQVSTGATEMGQGVNTKIRQIVAHCFSIPVEDVQVMSTSTEKNHNTSPTAASSGSDINAMAAYRASERILNRMKAFCVAVFAEEKLDALTEFDSSVERDISKITLKDGVFSDGKNKLKYIDILNQAYKNRVSLGEYEHYSVPGLGFDPAKLQGRAFNYFTNGAAVNEVLIDQYTGEMKILRTDILMDLGRPINEGVDRGQVSGGFVQGMGWVCTEKLVYAENGKLLTHSPTTYKIPSVHDIPREFNIEFLENHDNKRAVARSKAVGEPPFLLGFGVWMAIKNALSYRGEGEVELKSPATIEEILMSLNKRI